MVAVKRKMAAVITLLLVAPLVAEFLLGDLPLKLLPALIVLAPVYGGGAVLIRETARRTGRGWPMMLMLGAAYAFLGEGLVTQSLFNHDYLKMQMHLLEHAYVTAWGIGAWWTLFMVNLHAFWSMGVSIALVEALFPAEADAPWMEGVGDAVVGAVFVLGSLANFGIGFKQNGFVASPAQLLSVAGVSVLMVVGAFVLPARRPCVRASAGLSSRIPGAVAFVMGVGVLWTPPRWGWGAVGAVVALDVVFLGLVGLLSRRNGWGAQQELSLAAGGALAYGILAFARRPLLGGVVGMRVTHVIMLAAAVSVIGLGVRRVVQYQTAG